MSIARDAQIGVPWNINRNLTLREVSMGLADDTVLVSDSPESITRAYKCLREFFDLHGWKLNPSKTEVRYNHYGDTSKLTDPCWGVNHPNKSQRVTWKNEKAAFRYLGIWIRLDLDFRSHYQIVENNSLNPIWRTLCHQKLSVEQLTKTIGELIYSTLAYSTKFCAPTKKWTDKWNGRLCRAITQSNDLTPGCLKYDAMMYILGLPSLPHATAINFISEYFISLNSFRTKWDLSTRVTFRDNPKPLSTTEFNLKEPLAGIGVFKNKYDCHIIKNPHYTLDPYQLFESDLPLPSPTRTLPQPLSRYGVCYTSGDN